MEKIQALMRLCEIPYPVTPKLLMCQFPLAAPPPFGLNQFELDFYHLQIEKVRI